MTNISTTASASPLSSLPDSPEKLSGVRIKHTRIAQIMTELGTLIYPESQGSILLVCGPSGVGKSTLARHMVDSALQNASADMDVNAGLIPAVYVEAPSSGESDFSWRLFYQRILAQLEGELTLPKTAYGVDPATGRLVRPHGAANNSLAGLRTAVERALRARRTRFLVIDEAAHIIRQTRRNRLEIQLDTLKSLANECGTQMVLVGSYDLYQLVSLSGQLARRTHVLHFERYREDRPEDQQAFRACIQKFQSALPALWGQQLIQHADALHENTLGCVGTLSSVLTRAAMLAQKDGKWSVDALRRALLTEAQRQQILEEILDGEAAINPGLTRTMARAPRRVPNSERSAA
ncbi:ATPase [Herbaspirillum sp. HC18]|nr:ATPase [Herbaspirillum sp. HC18]